MKTILALLLLACAGTAAARGASPADLHYDVIGEVTSDPGMTEAQFLNRAASQLRQFSGETGFEACGAVARNATGYALRMTTNRSHMGCVIHLVEVPAGYAATQDTIHSHGRVGNVHANRADAVFSPGLGMGDAIHVTAADLHTFSAVDYASGPMYLAGDTGVVYQNGQGTDRLVAAQ